MKINDSKEFLVRVSIWFNMMEQVVTTILAWVQTNGGIERKQNVLMLYSKVLNLNLCLFGWVVL